VIARSSSLLALAAAFVLAVAACGGEDNESSSDTGAAGSSAQTIEISETEFKLDPADVTLDKAGTYTFRAVNNGSFDHALEIEGPGAEEETETIGPGSSAEVTVDLEEGTYELYCPVGNHKDQGMVGRVVVGSGGASSTTGTDEDDDSGSGRY
jgi:plastocyanin